MKPTPPPGKWRDQVVNVHNRRFTARNAQAELENKLRELKDNENDESRSK